MECPKCNSECERDSVDVGVGVLHGPWGCPGCGWSEDPKYDRSEGPPPAQIEAGSDRYVDQFRGSTSVGSIVESCSNFGIPEEMVRDAFETGGKESERKDRCPSCGSMGFDVSILGPNRCTFCDGTEGGNPPEMMKENE